MEKRQLIEVILSDLPRKMETKVDIIMVESKYQGFTKEMKETVLAVQKLILNHTRAFEALTKLLALAYKYNIVVPKNGDNVNFILSKIDSLKNNSLTRKYVSKFEKVLAELEVSIYSLESIGTIEI